MREEQGTVVEMVVVSDLIWETETSIDRKENKRMAGASAGVVGRCGNDGAGTAVGDRTGFWGRSGPPLSLPYQELSRGYGMGMWRAQGKGERAATDLWSVVCGDREGTGTGTLYEMRVTRGRGEGGASNETGLGEEGKAEGGDNQQGLATEYRYRGNNTAREREREEEGGPEGPKRARERLARR